MKSLFVFLYLFTFAGGTRADTLSEVQARVNRAAMTFNEIMAAQDRAIPDSLLKKAKCVAVFPSVVRAGFVFGAAGGKGLVSCRTLDGWSRPLFLKLVGGSVGFQIGVNKTDMILAFIRADSAALFNKARLTMGGDASIAAGPVGRTAEAGVDFRLNSEIYSYSRSRGFFAGVALKGTVLDHSDSANTLVYGGTVRSVPLLLGSARDIPQIARPFTDALSKYAP